MQGHWVMFGGTPIETEAGQIMYDFDFATLTWSKAILTGQPLKHRGHHAATCHQGAMVVVGGEPIHNKVSCMSAFHTAASYSAIDLKRSGCQTKHFRQSNSDKATQTKQLREAH